MSDSEQCSNRLQLDLMLILDNFLCELNRLNITFGWLQKLNPGYEICIISYQVNLSSEVSAMFNSLMPSLNNKSLPFMIFLDGFPTKSWFFCNPAMVVTLVCMALLGWIIIMSCVMICMARMAVGYIVFLGAMSLWCHTGVEMRKFTFMMVMLPCTEPDRFRRAGRYVGI